MQHLDDAALAELLDARQDGRTAGAPDHLAGCAECRARLEEARRVRDRARAILRAGVPDETPPPFAEVLARAGRGAARPRRVPWRGLAWAATVTLAAGVGWYGRELVLRTPETAPVETAPVIAAAPVEPPDLRPEAEAVGPTAAAVPQESQAQSAASGAGGPPPVTEQSSAPARLQPPAAAAPAPVGRLDLRPAAAERQRAAADAMAAEAAEELDAWRAVTMDEARTLLGGDLQRVEGLATLGYAVRPVRGGVEVRTEQRLASGDVLELLQRRATLATDEARAARVRTSGQPMDSIRRGDFMITARAAISLDSLRALLLRLH